MNRIGKIVVAVFLTGAISLLLAACGAKRSASEIIEELAVYYGTYGEKADRKVQDLLKELRLVSTDEAIRWEKIMELWASAEKQTLNYDLLPDGLPDTDELCLVVLGFQLNPDGSMREELIHRLETALACAEKYPNALIVCTGGGTASENSSVTEAGAMADWLRDQGVPDGRIIVEDRSLTTAQNAINTYDILTRQYPRVRQLAIISSDYHIATGTLLFEGEAILRAEKAGQESMHVVSNAAWKAPSGTLSAMFQAGALIELSGDVETAFKIYYEEYDIHELPSISLN